MIYNALHKQLKIDQHELHWKQGWNQVLQKSR